MAMSDATASPGDRARSAVPLAVPAVLAATAIALQIAYPLVPPGTARDRLTVVIVVVFAAAAVTHALLRRGPRFAAALVATTTLGGLAIEVIGVRTGLPFGEYRYLDSLGMTVLGVPLVVALAWTMMAYPAYTVSEVVGGGTLRRALVGGWALAAWDLFLDPQMVQAGHWEWRTSAWELAGIPVSNYAAWFAVATVMMLGLRALTAPGAAQVDDRVPLVLYVWTFASSVLAHAVFFGLPASALTGGIGMGIVVVALVRALRARSLGTAADAEATRPPRPAGRRDASAAGSRPGGRPR